MPVASVYHEQLPVRHPTFQEKKNYKNISELSTPRLGVLIDRIILNLMLILNED